MEKIYTIREILDIIKERGLNVQEISRQSGITADKLYKWMDGRGSPKHEDGVKLFAWAGKFLVEIPEKNTDLHQILVREETEKYSSKSFSAQALAELSKSNRILAESNKTLAEANKQLADNTVVLTAAYTKNIGGDDPNTSLDVLATIQALQEYLPEIAAKVKKTSVEKTAAELGTIMTSKRKALGKTGTRAGAGK